MRHLAKPGKYQKHLPAFVKPDNGRCGVCAGVPKPAGINSPSVAGGGFWSQAEQQVTSICTVSMQLGFRGKP
ncbi:MAG: hypothetical protein ACLTW6_08235, partial [Enterobacter sp.]